MYSDVAFTDKNGVINRAYETRIKVVIDDKEYIMQSPVMNGTNPVKDNSMSQQRVWNSMCRSFVKCVAIHTGLGFNLWLKEEHKPFSNEIPGELNLKDLREIVIGEADPQSLFDQWFSDYSVFLSSKMTASWESAYFAAWNSTADFVALEEKISSEIYVRDWIINRTGNLITNVCSDQVNAVRYLIVEAQSLGMGSDETARYIRPTIGLTERQAAANLRHYNSVKTHLKADHPRMKEESIERKARTAAAKYAERQQRYRAETIARSLSFCLHGGMD